MSPEIVGWAGRKARVLLASVQPTLPTFLHALTCSQSNQSLPTFSACIDMLPSIYGSGDSSIVTTFSVCSENLRKSCTIHYPLSTIHYSLFTFPSRIPRTLTQLQSLLITYHRSLFTYYLLLITYYLSSVLKGYTINILIRSNHHNCRSFFHPCIWRRINLKIILLSYCQQINSVLLAEF